MPPFKDKNSVHLSMQLFGESSIFPDDRLDIQSSFWPHSADTSPTVITNQILNPLDEMFPLRIADSPDPGIYQEAQSSLLNFFAF